jgi:hypothetical protein
MRELIRANHGEMNGLRSSFGGEWISYSNGSSQPNERSRHLREGTILNGFLVSHPSYSVLTAHGAPKGLRREGSAQVYGCGLA